jgi:hypothetical protein
VGRGLIPGDFPAAAFFEFVDDLAAEKPSAAADGDTLYGENLAARRRRSDFDSRHSPLRADMRRSTSPLSAVTFPVYSGMSKLTRTWLCAPR